MTDKIRIFESGATRDTDAGKLNYIRALSPIVLQYYVNYLGKHRVQSDGNLRDWDNWKNGIDKQTYLEGMDRHKMAVWLLHQGQQACDNHGSVTLEDSLCGVIFNAMGYLYELLKIETKPGDRGDVEKKCSTCDNNLKGKPVCYNCAKSDNLSGWKPKPC